jgi:hypothetical protein
MPVIIDYSWIFYSFINIYKPITGTHIVSASVYIFIALLLISYILKIIN